MKKIKQIHEKFGYNICRNCINRKYGASLNRGDCIYGLVYPCGCCKEPHHVVAGFTFIGKLKMLFK